MQSVGVGLALCWVSLIVVARVGPFDTTTTWQSSPGVNSVPTRPLISISLANLDFQPTLFGDAKRRRLTFQATNELLDVGTTVVTSRTDSIQVSILNPFPYSIRLNGVFRFINECFSWTLPLLIGDLEDSKLRVLGSEIELGTTAFIESNTTTEFSVLFNSPCVIVSDRTLNALTIKW